MQSVMPTNASIIIVLVTERGRGWSGIACGFSSRGVKCQVPCVSTPPPRQGSAGAEGREERVGRTTLVGPAGRTKVLSRVGMPVDVHAPEDLDFHSGIPRFRASSRQRLEMARIGRRAVVDVPRMDRCLRAQCTTEEVGPYRDCDR